MSDCGAIGDFFNPGLHETHPDAATASASAVTSGTDLECGWGDYMQLEAAVDRGLITEHRIDTSLCRLLEARFALGEMDDDSLVPWSRIGIDTVDCQTHKQMALDIARKSLVLLHNDGVLPLDKTRGDVVVMGPNAVDSVMQWGNYEGTPSHTYTVLDGIRERLGRDVRYEKGCNLLSNEVFDSYFHQLSHDGRTGLKATYWNNLEMKGEAVATQELATPVNKNNGGNTVFAAGVNLQNFTAVYEGTFRPLQGGKYDLVIEGDDGYRVYVNGEKVIDYWGEHAREKREYALDATAGKDYDIKIEYMQAAGEALLKFDVGIRRQVSPTEVVARVKDAGTVVFVGGISPDLEGEEKNHVNCPGLPERPHFDRAAPGAARHPEGVEGGRQESGVRQLLGVRHGLGAGIGIVRCHLAGWYPGQAGGLAVADVLFGDFNPGGKLPVTFYKNTEQLPDFEDYSMKGRTYRYMTDKPLFPFGYGLSYTTFAISKGRLSKSSVEAGEGVKFTAQVKNTGKRDGAEVVQVYVRKVGDTGGPLKSLRGFAVWS